MRKIRQNYFMIKDKIKTITQSCGRSPEEVTLIAVTKTHSIEVIQQAYQAGCRDFGENRIQEALDKIPQLPSDSRWHFIGSLQSNKIVKAISYFTLIHSIDTFELAQKLSEASQRRGITTSILLQVNTSGEKSKHGLSGQEWSKLIKKVDDLPSLSLEGLMTIAPLSENEKTIRSCFRQLRLLKELFQQDLQNPSLFHHLSMGMSQDYAIAIEEGATYVRLGSAIFGSRI